MANSKITARTILKLLLFVALLSEGAIWGLFALLAVAFGFTGSWLSFITSMTPVTLAMLLVSFALLLDVHPRVLPIAVIMALISTSLLAWEGYGFYLARPRTGPPPLAQGYDLRSRGANWNDPVQSARWTALLQKRFPVGSSAAELQKTLDDQRFLHTYGGPDTPPNGFYGWSQGGCNYMLTVRWTASSGGRISWIAGQSTHDHSVGCR